MADATFRASGLSSGMDTASIIDKLVELESRPIAILKSKQSGIKTQLSALADIISKLSSLKTSAQSLAKDGVLTGQISSTNTAFSAAAATGATAGRYSVQVTSLASAGKWRSGAFASSAAGMQGGDLALTVKGTTYNLSFTAGTSLADVATRIRALNAPISVQVLTGRDGAYLSITARDTGYTGAGPGQALTVAFSNLNGAGTDPTVDQTVQDATNAQFSVDGVAYVRQSNTVSDAVPGATLTLKQQGGPAEDLVVALDAAGTKAKLQKFADAYNDIMKLVQRQLAVTKDTDRASSLAGDSTVRALQARLQSVLVTKVTGLGDTQTLADIGLKTGRDGSLSIDQTTFDGALTRDPAAMDGLFSQATTGLSAVVTALVDVQTRSSDGVLTARKKGLDARVTSIDKEMETLQARVAKYRDNLVAQFTAMENAVSKYKSIGSFLANQASFSQKSS